MRRTLLTTLATTSTAWLLLGLAALGLSGCGGSDTRPLGPDGQAPVPTAEEKAQLKTDFSQK